MAALTWYLTNNSASIGSDLSNDDPGTEATRSPVTGWIVGTGSTNNSAYFNDVERAASTFADTNPPDGSLDTTNGDFWVSPIPYTGDFASANWVVHFACRATSSATGQDGRMLCRLFRGANQDGSSATEITAAQQTGTDTTDLTTGTTQVSSATFNPGAFSVSGEYIFIQIGWQRFGAASMSTADVNVRIGNGSGTGSRVITSSFAASAAFSSVAESVNTFEGTTPATIESGDVSSTGGAVATLTGAATATADVFSAAESINTLDGASTAEAPITSTGESIATLDGASVAEAVISMTAEAAAVMDGQSLGGIQSGEFSSSAESVVTLDGASIAEAPIESAGEAVATLEGASSGTIEGAISITGESVVTLDAASLADGSIVSIGEATLIMGSEDTAEAVYRPSWYHGTSKAKLKNPWGKRKRKKFECEFDDEEVYELARIALLALHSNRRAAGISIRTSSSSRVGVPACPEARS